MSSCLLFLTVKNTAAFANSDEHNSKFDTSLVAIDLLHARRLGFLVEELSATIFKFGRRNHTYESPVSRTAGLLLI